MPVRAMVLAAGFGTRLLPLTESLPKPLVPVANRPLIAFCLDRLKACGVIEAAVNLHHLGDTIREELGDGSGLGLSLTYSPEDEILGTGGGLVRMRPFLDRGTFFVLNGDVLSGVDLAKALDFHKRLGARATMVVRPLPDGAGYTPLEADASGRLVFFKGVGQKPRGKTRACMFCGVHVFEPDVFDFLPAEGFACINDQAYTAMLAAGLTVGAFWYEGPWFDLGTPQRYLEASGALLAGRARLPGFDPPVARSVLVDASSRVHPSARLGPEVSVAPGCTVGADARLSRTILWPNTTVAPGTTLNSAIATPDRVVSA